MEEKDYLTIEKATKDGDRLLYYFHHLWNGLPDRLAHYTFSRAQDETNRGLTSTLDLLLCLLQKILFSIPTG